MNNKGRYGGVCKVTLCEKAPAEWGFLGEASFWYCQSCAFKINEYIMPENSKLKYLRPPPIPPPNLIPPPSTKPVSMSDSDLQCILEEATSEGYPEMESVARELIAARLLISGVASCGSCGACRGAAQKYIAAHKAQPPADPEVCNWTLVKTLRGQNPVWAWQPACNTDMAISQRQITDNFIVCPYCTRSLVKS